MRPQFDIAVIGGGAGGLVVAAGGASLGAKVAVIEKHKLGGDCLWYGCVPSKSLIKSARVAHQMRHADRWAVPPSEPSIVMADVMERVADVIRGIEPNDSPERFRGLGVDVIFGNGRFTARDTFEVDGRRITARTFVIATGSRPAIPPIKGIDSVPYLTNESVFGLRTDVRSLIVVGSGPVGSELTQAFRRLGSDVSVLDIAATVMPREDPELAEIVHRQLVAEGVRYHLSAEIKSVEGQAGDIRVNIARQGSAHTVRGTHLLLAAGRIANVEDLGLEAAGVEVDNGRIVNRGLTTTNPSIYVIGDAAGGLQFTHVAEHHAGIILRRAIFRMKWVKPSIIVPWCTYTDPELARVGVTEAEAKERSIAHRVYRFPLHDIDRARAEGECEGMAKLVTDPRGKLIGAAIVAPHAGELIAECALAMRHGLKAADLSASIHAYPTFAMVTRRAADQRMKESLTPTSRAWIKRLFGLQGA
ncbi:MAG TPA: FAD-dependent oxidoreductase [Casimicrobiaceae bacterium]|nr:FAD-dependent oxidoreductase [Casimicrobiaceae bacterium]